MFFHLIVSSCISHNFNCPFLEPVTFAIRATLAVLHLIITLMSFYFVCYVYISRKLNFSFIWIFLLESWANLTVPSFDCFVCILRNFSCPSLWLLRLHLVHLITLLHSNLAQLLKVVGFIWLLRLYLSKLQLSFPLIVTFASRASKYRCPSIVIVAFTSHANSNVLLFGCFGCRLKLTVLSFNYFVWISYYFSCPFISLLKFPFILFVSLISRANLTFLSFWLFCLHPAQI